VNRDLLSSCVTVPSNGLAESLSMSTRISRREFAKRVIDLAIHKALDTLRGRPRKAFDDMLRNIQSRSGLLRPSHHVGQIEAASVDAILGGLLALFEQGEHWLRPVETWEPSGRRWISTFSSLAHHLIADYPVPPVMLSAWFLGTDWSARQKQHWFRHIGQGVSLRKVGFPIALSRKMAHEFAHAPAHYPIEFALRWAQVRALGGSDVLARTIAGTRLGRTFDNEEFWLSVLHFFINHPGLELARIDSIVEFLDDQKFGERQVVIGEDTEVYLDPPQPNLSIKGWSVATLLRRIEECKARQRAVVKMKKPTVIRWDRSPIGEFFGEDEAGRSWTIRELLDSDALAAEGKAMEHCVATYTGWCARRRSTIWSVAIEDTGGRERVATVEVNPESRQLIQAKARCNEEPGEPCLGILKRWASREALKVES
jgi:hypothetical protein